ncbi:MAG: hypothetical protein ACREOJ_17020 [Gemmatimonadaceae bacterium]
MIRSSHQRVSDSTRVYVKGEQLRIETSEAGKLAFAEVLDIPARTLTTINPATRQYAVVPFVSATGTGRISPLQAMFHPGNSGNPCDYWNGVLQSLATAFRPERPPTLSCSSAGSDNVSGRAAQKWAVTASGRPGTTYVSVDQSLGVVTRIQDTEETMELRHVAEGSQPDAMFQVPSGYVRTDLATLTPKPANGGTISSTANGAVEGAGKTLGKDAAKTAADAARQKADSSMAKKAKHIFHVP